jgi:hypothetical protein
MLESHVQVPTLPMRKMFANTMRRGIESERRYTQTKINAKSVSVMRAGIQAKPSIIRAVMPFNAISRSTDN